MPRQQLSCTAHGLSSWSCTGNPMCPGTGSIIIKILISWGDEIKDWDRRSVGLVLKIQFAQDSMPGAERERPEIVSPNAWTVREMIDSLNRNCQTISRHILLCFKDDKRHSYTKIITSQRNDATTIILWCSKCEFETWNSHSEFQNC